MNTDHYILVIAKKNLKPLKQKISEIGGFFNQLGYAFPSARKKEVVSLFKEFDKSHLKIQEVPLERGQSFDKYKQSYKVDFFRRALIEKQREIETLQSSLGVASMSEEEIKNDSSLKADKKESLLRLFHEEEELRAQIAWAESMERSLGASRQIELKFLSELPVNFLKEDAPPKPRLLYWIDPNGTKFTFLPREIVAMVVGAGGVGKTHVLVQLALCMASGIPFLGKYQIEKPGQVCLVLGENKMDDIHRLIRKVAKYLQNLLEINQTLPEYKQFGLFELNPLDKAAQRLSVFSVHGTNAHFLRDGQPTSFYGDFLSALKRKGGEWSMIIFDPLSRFAGLDAENDNAMATDFIALLERMSDELPGNPTVMTGHHKPKLAVSREETDQTAARGASGLTDGVRWQANLDRTADKKIVFRMVKSNFTGLDEMELDKGADGILRPVPSSIPVSSQKRDKYGKRTT